jgi:ParB-like chromosome segregation protein Spo0J
MSRTSTKLVRLVDLQPHPENQAIYSDGDRPQIEDDELLSSLGHHGIWDGQLQVHSTLTILHGHRRVAMALELGLEEAVVTVRHDLPEDPMDPEVIQFLLNGNAQREKTQVERLREFDVRKKVESELAKRRQAELNNPKTALEHPAPEREGGRARDLASRKAGLGSHGSRAEAALKALKVADQLEGSAPEKAKAIKASLNQSLSTGIRVAKTLTAEAPAVVKPSPQERVADEPQATMTLVDSTAKIAKRSNVMDDGKRHRNLKRCREMPGFRDELTYLQRELPKLHKYLQSAESKLRAIGDHFRDEYVKDRYNADFMTVWATAWADDGTIDYSKELEAGSPRQTRS